MRETCQKGTESASPVLHAAVNSPCLQLARSALGFHPILFLHAPSLCSRACPTREVFLVESRLTPACVSCHMSASDSLVCAEWNLVSSFRTEGCSWTTLPEKASLPETC